MFSSFPRTQRFGAYCSTKWQERKQTYFGTGETFLFTFTPQPKRYPWVGANSASDVPHSSKLFLSANQHMIQIGAGYVPPDPATSWRLNGTRT